MSWESHFIGRHICVSTHTGAGSMQRYGEKRLAELIEEYDQFVEMLIREYDSEYGIRVYRI